MVLFAGEALALEALDLVGEWKDGDNKIHRIKQYAGGIILLCRPVAEVSGGVRAYSGNFAQGVFVLVSKPRTIGDLNNKLPAALRRALLRLGAAYGARIKITDKGRKLIVQYITGTVTWTKSDPTKVDAIKIKLGRKVTLTHVINAKIVVEIATWKARRRISALFTHNHTIAELAYRALRGYFDKMGLRRLGGTVISIGSHLGSPSMQILNLKRQYRVWFDYDPGPKILMKYSHEAMRRARIIETIPKVLAQMRWLMDLHREEIKLLSLRKTLPDSTAASTGLRDMKSMNKFFWDAHYTDKSITLDVYADFVRLYARLKPELATIIKSQTTAAKPIIKVDVTHWNKPDC